MNNSSCKILPHAYSREDKLIPVSDGEPFVDIQYSDMKHAHVSKNSTFGSKPTHNERGDVTANQELCSANTTLGNGPDINISSSHQGLSGTNKHSGESLPNEPASADANLRKDKIRSQVMSFMIRYPRLFL